MRRRRRSRAVTAAVTAFAALVMAAGCGSASTPPPTPTPLRILLVNDGPWNAPGTTALREALRRAGHTVVQISPDSDRSNDGTAGTVGAFSARHPTADPGIWTTTGSPAAGTLMGVHGVFGWPDLVVAGASDSYNASVSALGSGTVGAAFAAAERTIPAVAVGTNAAQASRSGPPDFGPVAAFVVRLVAALQQRPQGARLLPMHTVLNVNYPMGPTRPKDVLATATSDVPSFVYVYRPGAAGTVNIVQQPTPPSGTEDDTTALARGTVTLTDLSADPDRATPPTRAAARVAPILEP